MRRFSMVSLLFGAFGSTAIALVPNLQFNFISTYPGIEVAVEHDCHNGYQGDDRGKPNSHEYKVPHFLLSNQTRLQNTDLLGSVVQQKNMEQKPRREVRKQ